MSEAMKGLCLFPAALLVATIPGAADHDDAGIESFGVRIQETTNPLFDYEPKVGLSTVGFVTFFNVDDEHHDILFEDGSATIGFLPPGEHRTSAVPPGVHPYLCGEHPWMHGLLRVDPA